MTHEKMHPLFGHFKQVQEKINDAIKMSINDRNIYTKSVTVENSGEVKVWLEFADADLTERRKSVIEHLEKQFQQITGDHSAKAIVTKSKAGDTGYTSFKWSLKGKYYNKDGARSEAKYRALARLEIAKGEFDEDVMEERRKRFLERQKKKAVKASDDSDNPVIFDAQSAVDSYKPVIEKLFPADQYFIKCGISGVIGHVLAVSIYNVPRKEATDLKLSNARVGLRFMIHLSDKFGKDLTSLDQGPFSMDEIHGGVGRELKNAGVKWRKISGKKPSEVMQKFIVWLQKNKDAIHTVKGSF